MGLLIIYRGYKSVITLRQCTYINVSLDMHMSDVHTNIPVVAMTLTAKKDTIFVGLYMKAKF